MENRAMFTPSADVVTAANDIASQLQETSPTVVLQIRRIVEMIGIEATYAFLQQTFEIEAQGGLLTQDKKRRRTPGGVFLYIVRGQLPPETRRILWPRQKRPSRSSGSGSDTGLGKSKARSYAIFPWENREVLAEPALAKKGVATTVKITLVGRPGKVIERNDAVIITMTGPKPPALPKGLPTLPADAVTVYLVYIASKQWRKAAESIQNPEDRLVIEGYPFMDAKLKVIGVLTQNITTVMLQRAQRTNNG
jgi:hypothetical protein